jgi:Dyp-type peroxidase family
MNDDPLLSATTKADLQGFITSGFGHLPHGAYLFVEIRDRSRGQSWLRALLPQITTASSWRKQADAPKVRPERTLNLAFTAAGLAAVGLSEVALRTFPPEFREGMASPQRSRILDDTGASAPADWEVGGPANPPIHALLILLAATRAELDAWCAEQRAGLAATEGGVVEHQSIAQYGERPAHGHEHFGFFDGLAQPVIKGIKGQGVQTGEFILGHLNEYGFFPASPVAPAVDDPAGRLPLSANPYHRQAGYRDLGANGTFVVYRKLAQDVAGFWQFLQAESIRHKGSADPAWMVWLASKMVGRWPSGAALVLAPEADHPAGQGRDDFTYAAVDPYGLACPFGAHVRRVNPRDQIRSAGPTESQHMSNRHRLLRRGKPYGPPLFDPTRLTRPDQPEALRAILDLQDDGQPRGIHFFCVNSSIKSQFEFAQQAWVNNPNFNGLCANPDPLAGANDPTATPPPIMVVPGAQGALRTAPLPRLVTVRGGAYCFMPSLTTLRYLAG